MDTGVDDLAGERRKDLAVDQAAGYEYEDVPSAITSSETPFNCYNTVITVRQEQVVQIIRYWIPRWIDI